MRIKWHDSKREWRIKQGDRVDRLARLIEPVPLATFVSAICEWKMQMSKVKSYFGRSFTAATKSGRMHQPGSPACFWISRRTPRARGSFAYSAMSPSIETPLSSGIPATMPRMRGSDSAVFSTKRASSR